MYFVPVFFFGAVDYLFWAGGVGGVEAGVDCGGGDGGEGVALGGADAVVGGVIRGCCCGVGDDGGWGKGFWGEWFEAETLFFVGGD